MTREEAITILSNYDLGFYDINGHPIPQLKLAEACDMAIEALSADITDTEICQRCQETTERILNRQGERIKELEESAEAVQGWIPCSERLPEEHEWVGTKRFGTTISDLVHVTFDVDGDRFVKTLSLQNGELSNHEKYIMDTFYKGWKMIAWMPLPEPYEPQESEDKE